MPEWALAYRFDVVLGGSAATPLERLIGYPSTLTQASLSFTRIQFLNLK